MPIPHWLISRSDNPQWMEVLQTRMKLRDIYFEYWLQKNLFSLVWWLMLILVVSSWYIWWKHVDKSRLLEIVAYGATISLIATFVDIVGCEYVLWGYTIDLIPLISPLIVTDYCFLPITYMLVYQSYSGWKAFTAAAIAMSAFLAFVAEPVAVLLDIYQMNEWHHLYSFPMYLVLAFSLKWLIGKIMTKQSSSGGKPLKNSSRIARSQP